MDKNQDGIISEEEFLEGCEKVLDQKTNAPFTLCRRF